MPLLTAIARLDKTGISPRQALILDEIARHPRPPTLRAVATALGLNKPAITRNMDALASAGLAERRPDPADKRSILLARTKAGTALMRALEKDAA